ncbi:MAG: hypothetical protein IH969_08990 [Candidatus Krumholzibacteriota bacterium]|nr:hypothetical protein [Candidatus Krumholzibacteriota bacterium]
MHHTIEDAKKWTLKHSEELDKDRLANTNPDVQLMNRIMPPGKMKELWDSGEWLNMTLRAAGATEEQAFDICFAQGQRAFGGCPWNAAVNYANEFEVTGDTEEKGGMELADKRNRELFGE